MPERWAAPAIAHHSLDSVGFGAARHVVAFGGLREHGDASEEASEVGFTCQP